MPRPQPHGPRPSPLAAAGASAGEASAVEKLGQTADKLGQAADSLARYGPVMLEPERPATPAVPPPAASPSAPGAPAANAGGGAGPRDAGLAQKALAGLRDLSGEYLSASRHLRRFADGLGAARDIVAVAAGPRGPHPASAPHRPVADEPWDPAEATTRWEREQSDRRRREQAEADRRRAAGARGAALDRAAAAGDFSALLAGRAAHALESRGHGGAAALLAGVARGGGLGGGLALAAEEAGGPLAGGLAGRAGLYAEALKRGAAQTGRLYDIAADPHETNAGRASAVNESWADTFGLGGAYRGVRDFHRRTNFTQNFGAFGSANGVHLQETEDERLAKYRKQFADREATQGARTAAALQSDALLADLGGRKDRDSAYAGLRLERQSGHDKGTAAGQLLFEEEMRLIPLKQGQQRAARERLAAEKTAGRTAEEMARAEADELAARKALAEASRARVRAEEDAGSWYNPFTGTSRADRLLASNAEAEALREYETKARRAEAARGRAEGAAGGMVASRLAEDQARIAVKEGDAQNLRLREATAVDRRASLAAMGPEARMQAEQSFQLLKQIGVGNAPAELQASAAQWAPLEVRKMQEAAGDPLAERARASGAEASYRDRPDELRRELRRRDEEVTADKENALKQSASSFVTEFAALIERMRAAVSRSEGDATLKNEATNARRHQNGVM